MKNKYILAFILFFVFGMQNKAQAHDSISSRKSFFNLGVIGTLSTNGEYTGETTNNISISLIYGNNRNVYGFALAPFNYIESSMYGLQVGVSNVALEKVRGLQIGFTNTTGHLRGMQIGGLNFKEQSGGVQLGLFNMQKSGGLQLGLANYAEHNDYPIGFVNIIKDGDMNAGMTIDEMSNLTATFRSGGRCLYGIAGAGYSFSSSLSHIVFEGGIGAHLHLFDRFRIDTEIAATYLTKTYSYFGDPEEAEERTKDYDFKTAYRLSFRLLPSVRIGKHLELFGGPSINYLQSQCMENKKIFPSHYIWRKSTSTSLKQIHMGWLAGVQYKI